MGQLVISELIKMNLESEKQADEEMTKHGVVIQKKNKRTLLMTGNRQDLSQRKMSTNVRLQV